MSKILYQDADGSLSVIHPTGELSTEDVAQKDVPEGRPYLIVEDDVIPSDRSFRNAWEADFSNPDGYGIGADAWFAAHPEPVNPLNPNDAPAEEVAE